MTSTFQAPRLARRLQPMASPILDDDTAWEGVEITGELAGYADRLEIAGSHLVDATCTGVELTGLRLQDCRIERCEFSGALLEQGALQRVQFIDCRLSGVVLTNARLRHVRFTRCRMDGATLRMLTGDPVIFDECQLERSDFYAAQLAGARFRDCDLTDADFSQSVLTGATLHGSRLDGVGGGAAFRGVHISPDQILVMAQSVLTSLGIVVTEPERDPDEPAPGS